MCPAVLLVRVCKQTDLLHVSRGEARNGNNCNHEMDIVALGATSMSAFPAIPTSTSINALLKSSRHMLCSHHVSGADCVLLTDIRNARLLQEALQGSDNACNDTLDIDMPGSYQCGC